MAPPDEAARSPAPAHDAPRRPGVLPAALVAVFAFLLASFPARNSDLWMHLAAGRDLAHAPFSGTLPPFGPTWLADLLFFALYSAVGGPGLVLLKALLV